MHIHFERTEAGTLVARVSAQERSVEVSCAEAESGLKVIGLALADLDEKGIGECFWPHECGEYRWIFRNAPGGVEVVVLWSTGTLTGWEAVAWGVAPRVDLDAYICSANL
jgi:hypothetical protein